MKKTYKNPTLTVVKIQPNHLMLQGSFGEGTMPGGSAAGRRARFSDWDEEEFE